MLEFGDDEYVQKEEFGVRMRVSEQGFHVVSEKTAEALSKKKISASAITSLSQCPAKWAGENFVLKELIVDDGDNPANRGSLYHKVMEDFFSLEPEQRTNSELKRIVEEVSDLPEFNKFSREPEVRSWLNTLIGNYAKMGAKPKKVKVAVIDNPDYNPEKPEGKYNPKQRKGIEVFVTEQLVPGGRKVLGLIDRLIVDPRDPEALIVEDWKTGKLKPAFNPKKPDSEGLAESRQQMLYTMILEKMGHKVSAARLIYPAASEVVNVPVDNELLRQCVIEGIEKTNEIIDTSVQTNTFEYKSSVLCAWCPMAKICPEAMILNKEKFLNSYSSQPDPEVLLEGFTLS